MSEVKIFYMAITKIIGSIHKDKNSTYNNLKKCLNYIVNEEKTDNYIYVGSNIGSVDNALEDFISTYQLWNKEPKTKKDRLAYHLCISWKPEENVSPDLAFKIVQQFVETYIPNYESVYSVHKDKEHIHSHICFNAVNYVDGLKYRYNNNDWEKNIQPLVDKLCKDNGLETLEETTGISLDNYQKFRDNNIRKPKDNVRHSNNKYYNEKKEVYSKSDYLRDDLDYYINISNSFDEFIRNLENNGYLVKRGKSEKYGTYTAIKYNGMDKYRRTYSLGKNYSDSMIKERISFNKRKINKDDVVHYFIPKRFYRVKINYDFSNPVIRHKFYSIYKIGVGGNVPRPPYKEIKKALVNLNKLQYQLSVLENGTDINLIKNELKSVQNELKDINLNILHKKKSIRNINNMIKKYNKYDELLLLSKSKYNKPALNDLIRLKRIIDTYPYNKADLEQIRDKYKNEIKDLKKYSREISIKEESYLDLISELQDKRKYDISIERFNNEVNVEYINNDISSEKIIKK